MPKSLGGDRGHEPVIVPICARCGRRYVPRQSRGRDHCVLPVAIQSPTTTPRDPTHSNAREGSMTADTATTAAPTTHQGILDFVAEVAALTTPDRVYWCTGSDEEWTELTDALV